MAKIFIILAIIYFNAYPIPLPAVVGNAVVGNASKRCNYPNVTLGGVTHYVTHYVSFSFYFVSYTLICLSFSHGFHTYVINFTP